MPADDGLRLDENEMVLPPAWPEPKEPDPQDPVALPEPELRLVAKRDLQLLPQCQVSKNQVATSGKTALAPSELGEGGFRAPARVPARATSQGEPCIQIEFCRPTGRIS